MRPKLTFALIFAAGLATALPTAAQKAAAPEVTGGCNPNRVQYRTATAIATTNSTDFAYMPGAGVTINPTSTSCVIVVFTGQLFFNNQEDHMIVRTRVSGMGAAGLSQEFWAGRVLFDSFNKTRTMQFVIPDVPPGRRNVRLQFRSNMPTAHVSVTTRNITVHFRR